MCDGYKGDSNSQTTIIDDAAVVSDLFGFGELSSRHGGIPVFALVGAQPRGCGLDSLPCEAQIMQIAQMFICANLRLKCACDVPASAIASQTMDEVRELLQTTSTGEPIMQTFIDRYIEQGRQEGRQEGEAAVLLRLVERKFGPVSETTRQRIAAADVDTLLQWSDRILSADSLEAVLH